MTNNIFDEFQKDLGKHANVGSLEKQRKIRSFSLSEFDEKIADGYVKLIQHDDGLAVQVIDTYGLETEVEHTDYLNRGYIKMTSYSISEVIKRPNGVSYRSLLRYYQAIEKEMLRDKRQNKKFKQEHFLLESILHPYNLRHVVFSLYQEEGLNPQQFGEKIGRTEKEILALVHEGIVSEKLLVDVCSYFSIERSVSFNRYLNC